MLNNNVYIVYKTTNLLNGMIYVGVHINETVNFDGYYGSNSRLKNSIKKYGKENFIRETLFDNLVKEDAYDLESLIVDENFCKRPDVYNQKNGGFGGSLKGREFHKSDTYRNKLKTGAKKYKKYLEENDLIHHNKNRILSEETKQKMADSATGKHIGSLNHMYGISYEDHPKGMLNKPHKEETKIEISDKLIAYYSENVPYVRTDEIRLKISNSKKGKPSKRKGIGLTEETKAKMKKPKSEKTCPHCNLVGRGGNMIRYHFNNCKENINVK